MARIVLIDDEVRLLHTLARFLEREGHTVIAGERFDKVQDHVWPGRFELLLTDIVMPDFTGMAVLHEVVEKRGCREPVVLITGEPNLETASEAVRTGAFDYVSKPVTKDKLLEIVARALRHVGLVRERDQARENELQVLRSLAALGESASVISHEIRTPVTSLRHALRAVGQKLGVDDKQLVEELVRGLDRIDRVLAETLSFARPLRLDLHDTDLSALIQAAVAQAGRLAPMADMSVHVEVEPGLPRIRLDAVLFENVLVNLLRNAGEACNGKGTVEIAARRQGDRVAIDVADDGPGVPRDRREEIFRPFQSSKQLGTGLGLALCRKIVESHGGRIGLVDRAGSGACFHIELRPDGPPTHTTSNGHEHH
jgi:signal transduction histidine kinase